MVGSSMHFLHFWEEGHCFMTCSDFKQLMHRRLSRTRSILLLGDNAMTDLHLYKGGLSFLHATQLSSMLAVYNLVNFLVGYDVVGRFFTISWTLFSKSHAGRSMKFSRSASGDTFQDETLPVSHGSWVQLKLYDGCEQCLKVILIHGFESTIWLQEYII